MLRITFPYKHTAVRHAIEVKFPLHFGVLCFSFLNFKTFFFFYIHLKLAALCDSKLGLQQLIEVLDYVDKINSLMRFIENC